MSVAPPFSILGLDHVVLRADNPQRLIAFYRDILGCTVDHDQPKIGLTHLRAGSALIDIMDRSGALASPGDAAPERARRNVDHICLRIDPFNHDAIAAHLESHGIAIQPPANRYGAGGEGLSIYLSDPEGNVVELKGGE
ncbi:MAG: VOC family protein [Ferrovibrio sp.]|uniref:VOC family protein n=1 Tax=Ferrovibrio sp. TaxID=1917215 RepID=UPI002614AA35|nr:VOC family protein [Ferrovibrio sp.]MCW0235478.1 VOC family protein [Ferrovibrio sp.]